MTIAQFVLIGLALVCLVGASGALIRLSVTRAVRWLIYMAIFLCAALALGVLK